VQNDRQRYSTENTPLETQPAGGFSPNGEKSPVDLKHGKTVFSMP
jgi:hypothetical protein